MSKNERELYIGFITNMLNGMSFRTIKIVYEFMLGLTKNDQTNKKWGNI